MGYSPWGLKESDTTELIHRLHIQREQSPLCGASIPRRPYGACPSPGTQEAACAPPTGSHICVEKASF